jgi:hypothetical protein
MFSLVAARLQTIAALDRSPGEKIDLAIEGMATFIQDHSFFPAIMLREVAEGGAHLDRETLKALGAVPAAVALIVQEGVASGAFRPVNPVFAYFSMLTPIVLFLAGSPMRRNLRSARRQHALVDHCRIRAAAPGVRPPLARARRATTSMKAKR